jgi:hypothetical protein
MPWVSRNVGHLRRARPDQGEHAPVRAEIAEPVRPGLGPKRVCQSRPMSQHCQAHRPQLIAPFLPQDGIIQDRLHHARAVIGREGVVLPVELRQRPGGRRARCAFAGHDQHDARPFPVEAEILGTTGGDEDLRQALGQQTRAGGVLLQAFGEAQIGHVDEGDGACSLADFRDLPPIIQGKVRPGRVVATGMKQDQVARLCLRKIGQHPIPVDAPRLRS